MSNELTLSSQQQQLASIGAGTESSRAVAEIQAALTVAVRRPRDEIQCLDRIKNACQRPRLAERAEYSYSRGGSDISGPSIDLLTEIARHWGNLQFGFRELSQRNGESEVEAFAWDLESNSKRTVVFTVPHVRVTKSSRTVLTDPRDIYETVANNAQRRVRACLEAVIPSDIVDEALDQVHETLKANANVTPEGIKSLVEAFGKIGVTRQQIEARIQRAITAIAPAQLISMRRIYKSIVDQMSEVKDWFETQSTDVASVLKRAAAKTESQPAKPATQSPQPTFSERIAAAKTTAELDGIASEIESATDLPEEMQATLYQSLADRQQAIAK